jgi:hypothetical protein
MLEGRSFTVFTDHRPLVGALSRCSDPWSSRQQRHLSFIAEFSPTIRHIAGQSNVVADTLSRPACVPPTTPPPRQPGASSAPLPGASRVAADSGGTCTAAAKSHPVSSQSSPSGGLRVAAEGRTEVKAPSGSSVHTVIDHISDTFLTLPKILYGKQIFLELFVHL